MKESTKAKLRSFVEARGTVPDRGLTDMVMILTNEMDEISKKKEALQEDLEKLQEKFQDKIDALEASWNMTGTDDKGNDTKFAVTLDADGLFVKFDRAASGISDFKTPSDLLTMLKGYKITNWDRQY